MGIPGSLFHKGTEEPVICFFVNQDMRILSNHYVLAVPDLKRSVTFYANVLGFKPVSIEDPGWMFMVKDECTIRLGECPDALDPNELGDHAYFAFLRVDDVDEFYSQVKRAGGNVLRDPVTQPWGWREFPLRTVDGHRIMIGQAL
jgi:predicted enzyme related to lactoylglutathione lyase